MKKRFPEYLDRSDFKSVWKDALFVFDANVLLNLYRYQQVTRDEWLQVLDRISDRIWLPHYAALEFQRARLRVIAGQMKRFSDVEKALNKAQSGLEADLGALQLEKRHSLIDPEPLMKGLEELVRNFLGTLKSLEGSQQSLTGPDPIKTRLEDLFDGRVGEPPSNQESLDSLYREAEKRYEVGMPPGYKDSVKGKNDEDVFAHGGLFYKKRFGDFLLWIQMLDHAKANKRADVIFVTDDAKEDWWQKIDAGTPRTVGPRPELLEEARRRGSIKELLIYSSQDFLKYSEEHLAANVSKSTLTEVREVASLNESRQLLRSNLRSRAFEAEEAVRRWLERMRGPIDPSEQRQRFPDFVINRGSRRTGIEIKFVAHARAAQLRLRDLIYRIYFELSEGRIDEFEVIWVLSDPQQAEEFIDLLRRTRLEYATPYVRMTVGFVDDRNEFVPLDLVFLDDLDDQSEDS